MEKTFIVSGFDENPKQMLRILYEGLKDKHMEYEIGRSGNIKIYYKTTDKNPVLELEHPKSLTCNKELQQKDTTSSNKERIVDKMKRLSAEHQMPLNVPCEKESPKREKGREEER